MMTKGSPEALAWAKKMKKARIRAAGRRTEQQFFGPGGEFEDEAAAKARTNPTGGPFDKDAARELELYGNNNADLYRQMEVPIRLNLEKKYKKGLYQSALAVKLWQGWADEAAKRYNKEFGGGGSKWFEIFSPATRRHVAQEQEAFHKGEMELGNFQVKNNPKTGWYVGLTEFLQWQIRSVSSPFNMPWLWATGPFKTEDHAKAWTTKYQPPKTWPPPKRNPGRPHGTFRSCVRQVSHKRLPRGSDPKRICGAAMKQNPITLTGNPPKHIRTDVAGVLYNRVWEIQAEKTGDKHKGFWYHPFKAKSDVQLLALDSGDLLVHSTAGKHLWVKD